MPDPIISVIICTYNRAKLLRGVLGSLVEQTLDSNKYEVVVVDNNSTDSTQLVANEYADRNKNIKVVCDKRQGKTYAANTGIASSKGKYLAFIDDDAKATPEWLEQIVNTFETVKPEPASVGGSIYPWYEQTPPEWFSDDYETRVIAEKKGFLLPPHARFGFSGSNMAFPKRILEKYDCFTPGVGPVGKKFAIGDEITMYEKIYREDPYFWYDPDIRVNHFVPTRNMNLKYRMKRTYLGGVSMILLHKSFSVRLMLKLLLFVIIKSSILPFQVPWGQKGWQRIFLKYAQPIAGDAGMLMGIIFREYRKARADGSGSGSGSGSEKDIPYR